MQNNDDKFESFLRQFRPRAPQPLRIERREPVVRRPFLVALAAVAVVLIAGILTIDFRGKQSLTPGGFQEVVNVGQLSNPQPLTIGKANALLAEAPSVKAALDQMFFKSESTQLAKGQHSALAVLGEENMKR